MQTNPSNIKVYVICVLWLFTKLVTAPTPHKKKPAHSVSAESCFFTSYSFTAFKGITANTSTLLASDCAHQIT